MAQTIKLKRSAVAGRIPSTSDLDLGEIGINTVDGKAYIKKSVSGVESVVQLGSAAAAADAIMVEYQFTATNNQTSFSGGDDNSVQLGYTSGAVQVFLNGVLLDNGIDYTANNSVSVVLAEAATTGDFLQVIAFKKKIGEGNVSVATLSGNGTATAYTLPLDPDNENNTRVFIDGVYQSKSNYSVSGTTLTFSTAPPNGTAIEVEISGRSVTLDTAATIDLPDNTKLTAGDAGDLEIFHDASNSYIKDVGTGNLKISTNNQVDITKGTSETMATFVADGAATLYHDNAAKIATSATGVTITGAAAATTFSGDLSGTINTATTAATQSAGNNSTKVATTAYVDVAIAALGDSAPNTLNTLNELAAALGDDANFAATTATALGLRVSKTADTGAAVMPAGTTAQRPTAVAGQFRYNSTLGKFEGYTDAWGEIGGGGAASFAADNFTGNGSTTAYALTTPAASEDNLLVFIEGVFQQQNAFSIATSSGTTTLTFSAAPANGNSIIIYRLSPAVNGTNLTSNTMTGDGSDTTLTLSAAPVNENNTQVFVNGVYQNKSTYSISGTTLTFSEAPPTGALVECMTMNQLDINVPVDDSITSAKLSGNLTTPGTLAVTGGITATTADNTDTLSLISTDADASAGPNLRMYRNSASPADADVLGVLEFEGRNDNSQDVVYAAIKAKAADVSDGTEDSSIFINSMVAGTLQNRITILPTEVVINEGSQDLDFRVESDANTHALFVEGSSGNVGIGTTSTYNMKTTIAGTGSALTTGTGSYAVASIYDTTTPAAGTGGGLAFQGDDGTNSAVTFAVVNGSKENATGGNYASYLGFSTRANSAALSEKMRIDSNGKVGIGTNSPSTKLQVNASSAIADELILKLDGSGVGFNGNNDANIKHGLSYELCSYSSSTGVVQRQAAKIEVQKVGSWNEAAGGTGTKADLVFSTNNGTVATPAIAERMRIDSSGSVGIGVVPETWQSTIDALQVGLGASFAGNTVNPSRAYLSANYYINSSNQESYIATDEASQYFQNAGTHTFKVAPSGSADSAISWNTAMNINNSGNVGIGTTAPGRRLEVAENTNYNPPGLGNSGGHFGIFKVDSGASKYGLIAGVMSTGSVFQQVQRIDGTATAYNLALQPSGGAVLVGTTGTTLGGSQVISAGVQSSHTTGAQTMTVYNSSTSCGANGILLVGTARTANSAFDIFNCWTAGIGDKEFKVRGDGNVFADGPYSGTGADYAEFFEWLDGNSSAEDRRGYSVVLDSGKIRVATSEDNASQIIGVISANPAVIGDNDMERWRGKYLRDDFGSHDLDSNGDKQLNPDYDEAQSYVSREDRVEWGIVGLMGKLRIHKGQPTGSNWIKIKDISAGIEEWLVR